MSEAAMSAVDGGACYLHAIGRVRVRRISSNRYSVRADGCRPMYVDRDECERLLKFLIISAESGRR